MTQTDNTPDEESDGAAFADSGQLAIQPDDDDAGTLMVYPPANSPAMWAGDFLDQHVHMLEKAWRIADVVCQTPAAPKAYRGKPKEGTVAILYGAEVGLPPMASLQKVINVNGNPGFEARTMKGLLKTKGFKFRTITKTAEEFEIWAWEPDSPVQLDDNGKRINPDEKSRWDMNRARQAGFCPRPDPDQPGKWIMRAKSNGDQVVDGNMKYIEQPIEMLEAKGTADVCRSIAPEILLGLPYAAEELGTEAWAEPDDTDRVPAGRTPQRTAGRASRGGNRLRDRARTAAAAKADNIADAEVVEDQPTQQSGAQPQQDSQPDTQDAPPPVPPPSAVQQPAEENASPAAAPGDADAEVAQAAAPASPETEPTPDLMDQGRDPDAALSVVERARGQQILAQLLTEAKVEIDPDKLAVVAEIAAKRQGVQYRQIHTFSDLTDADLKHVVDALRQHQTAGDLYDYGSEALNAASLREAGLT